MRGSGEPVRRALLVLAGGLGLAAGLMWPAGLPEAVADEPGPVQVRTGQPTLEPSAGEHALQGEPETSASGRRRRVRRLGPVRPRQPALRISVALGGAALLAFEAWRSRGRRRTDGRRRVRDGLLLLLGAAGGILFLKLPVSVALGQLHLHEFYHYYLGVKYADELGATRLYACTSVADFEDGLASRVEGRSIRSLETYRLEPASAVVADADARCKAHFSPERWELFAHDNRFFRERMSQARWERLLKDHGYNGTPVWALLGSALAGDAPVSEPRLHTLALIDPLLIVAVAGVAGWAFGWRVLCVALIFLGTYIPGASRWTAGAFLRQDWFLASVAGIALLRRGKPAAAGASLAYASMLRIFPVVLLAGVGAKVAMGMLRARRPRFPRDAMRLAIAGGATALLLLVSSSSASGGLEAWTRFAAKAKLHLTSPLLNYMGLATLVAYGPAVGSTRTVEPASADSLRTWKVRREGTLERRRPWLWLSTGALGLLVLFAVRDQPDWVAAALGVGLLPLVGELTCYYYVLYFVFALLVARSAATGAILLVTAALSQVVEMWWVAVTDIFAAQSALILLATATVLLGFATGRLGGPGAARWVDGSGDPSDRS